MTAEASNLATEIKKVNEEFRPFPIITIVVDPGDPEGPKLYYNWTKIGIGAAIDAVTRVRDDLKNQLLEAK